MPGINSTRYDELNKDFRKVLKVLAECPEIDKNLAVPLQEFTRRQLVTWQALEQADLDAGFVFSDEHYDGDVPYLGGNTNITIEQVAGVIGKNGFHIIAGLEGGYALNSLQRVRMPKCIRLNCYNLLMKNILYEQSESKMCSIKRLRKRSAGLGCLPLGK